MGFFIIQVPFEQPLYSVTVHGIIPSDPSELCLSSQLKAVLSH